MFATPLVSKYYHIISMSMICFKIVKGKNTSSVFFQAADTQVIKQIQIMSHNLE